jgi:hypothetical protein
VETNRKVALVRGWGPKDLNVMFYSTRKYCLHRKRVTAPLQTIWCSDLTCLLYIYNRTFWYIYRICLQYNKDTKNHDGTEEEWKKKFSGCRQRKNWSNMISGYHMVCRFPQDSIDLMKQCIAV